MELPELSGIGTLNPTASHHPQLPKLGFHESGGSSCLFPKSRHCGAHKESLAGGLILL